MLNYSFKFFQFLTLGFLIFSSDFLHAQIDSLNNSPGNPLHKTGSEPLVLNINAYIDAYYAISSDSLNYGDDRMLFNSVCPHKNEISVNMARFAVHYSGAKARANLALFWGDVPRYSWDPQYPMLHEANLGLKLNKKLWLDAGFFATHIGIEMMTPRDNIFTLISQVTYFEPFYMAAGILTWNASPKFTIRGLVLNGYYNLIRPTYNGEPGLGFVASYAINENSTLNLCNITTNEAGTSRDTSRRRSYFNANWYYNHWKWTFQASADVGFQTHTVEKKGTAWTNNVMAIFKYNLRDNISTAIRLDYFSDKNSMLSAPIDDHKTPEIENMGFEMWGGTLGLEFRPTKNGYIRWEGRYLQTPKNEDIFYYGKGNYKNYRLEAMISIGYFINSGNLLENVKRKF